ncbi:flagellar hook-length control protein FliK [Aneurinibacillus sp. REN35]|uniref:flagellar hook-length control protein FliK n=1 Tax=Aneurinibacillus sp. REN35 TaxID=3237286 RepID=UPI0035290963
MTTVQITGSSASVKAMNSSSGIKGDSSSVSSFASEMQAAIQQTQTKDEAMADQGALSGGQQSADIFEQMTELLDMLTSLADQPTADADEWMEEVYAALQQLYQLVQQVNENNESSLSSASTDNMMDLLRNSTPLFIGLTGEGKVDKQMILDWKQKIEAMMNVLTQRNSEALPKELETKIYTALTLLENASKTAQVKNEVNQASEFASSFIPRVNNADTKSSPTIANPTVQMEEQSAFVLEEGTTTQAMHHQLQGTGTIEEALLGRASIPSNSVARNADIPLVPARFFANEMEVYIVKQVKMNQGTGAMETTLRLFPENLGRVDIRITALNGTITAHFMASQAAGKEAIEQQMNHLRHALMQQGLHVEKIEVSYVTTTPSEQSNNNLLQQEKENAREEQGQDEEQSSEEAAEFNLEELIGNTEDEAVRH